MQAGRLDRRITLQSLSTTQDGYGEPVETWSNLATVWARKASVSPSEVYDNSQRLSQAVVKWHIRYRTDVKTEYRIRSTTSAEVYRIVGVEEIGRRKGLILHTIAERDDVLTIVADLLITQGGDQLITQSGNRIILN